MAKARCYKCNGISECLKWYGVMLWCCFCAKEKARLGVKIGDASIETDIPKDCALHATSET